VTAFKTPAAPPGGPAALPDNLSGLCAAKRALIARIAPMPPGRERSLAHHRLYQIDAAIARLRATAMLGHPPRVSARMRE